MPGQGASHELHDPYGSQSPLPLFVHYLSLPTYLLPSSAMFTWVLGKSWSLSLCCVITEGLGEGGTPQKGTDPERQPALQPGSQPCILPPLMMMMMMYVQLFQGLAEELGFLWPLRRRRALPFSGVLIDSEAEVSAAQPGKVQGFLRHLPWACSSRHWETHERQQVWLGCSGSLSLVRFCVWFPFTGFALS